MDVTLNILSLLTWIDYALLSVILILAGYLLKLGFGRSFLNLLFFSSFLLLSVLIATELAQQNLVIWLLKWQSLTKLNPVSTMIIVCILGLYIARFIVYKILKYSLNIYNPCWFYGFLFWLMAWVALLLVFAFSPVLALINKFLSLQIQLYDYSYWLIFMASLVVVVLALKLIRFDVYNKRDCFLKQGFVWLLQKIHILANFIHTNRDISFTNRIISMPVALVYSVIFVSVYLAFFNQFGLIVLNAEQSFMLPYFGIAITEINNYIQPLIL